ncbi:hypothetical protein MKX01_037148 [Papaver californicum]|nr:hypothetical protein MKX01_037148 [Papaver californicum]
MDRVRIQSALAVLFTTILFLMPTKIVSSQRPLCTAQYALANQACSAQPVSEELFEYVDEDSDDPESQRRRSRNRSRERHGDNNQRWQPGHSRNRDRGGHEHGHNNQHRQPEHSRNRDGGGHGNNNQHLQHENGHRNSRNTDRERHGHNNQHYNSQHQRRRSRRRRHHHHLSQQEKDCCRWLKEMDEVCVCQLLFRMPFFMWKPKHDYVIKLQDACTVTFNCKGRSF